MRIEWAIQCQDVVEEGSRINIVGLGRNGYIIEDELPVSPTCPVVVCFRPEADDEAGRAFGFNYRVLDPHGAVIDARRTGIEWNRGTAPQVVEPERYYKTLEVQIEVQQTGQYAVEVWLDGGEPVRLPYLFSAWAV